MDSKMIKETYRLKLWYGNAQLPNMKQLSLWEWGALDLETGYTFTFKGERATVHTFSDDSEITREIALKCAEKFMDGSYVTIAINLDRCTGETSQGEKH